MGPHSRLLVALCLFGLHAEASAEPPPEVGRLAALGRLWGTARYLHPHLAWQKIDWDRALVNAIPQVRAAADRDDYRAAVAKMLAALGDPETRVSVATSPAPPLVGAPIAVADGVLVARLRSLRSDEERQALQKAVGSARAVVLDLRIGSDFESEHVSDALSEVQELLTTRAAPAVRRRHLQHIGHSEDFSTASFAIDQGVALSAPPKPQQAVDRRLVLLANRTDTLSQEMLALLADGQAQLVVTEEACGVALAAIPVPLGEGLAACLQIEEIADGRTIAVTRAFAAGPGEPDAALARARSLLKAPAPRPRRAAPLLPGGLAPERGYPEMTLPTVEYRLLALFRYWNIVRHFDPYVALFDRPWEGQLEAYIPKLIAAASQRDYVLTLAALATHTDDSHAFAQGPPLWTLRGEAAPPLTTDLIEGQLAVTACLDKQACDKAGARPGDVVVSIDGQKAQERFSTLRRYATGSHPERRDHLAALHLLWGAEGSTAQLELRGGSGQTRRIALPRSAAYKERAFGASRGGPVFRLLSGNIGYLDLERLQLEDIEPALAKIRDTPVTILDMRGYPRGRVWDLLGRFNSRRAPVAAIIRQPTLGLQSAADTLAGPPVLESTQRALPTTGPLYRGKTIMLVDVRTQSQAEHLALHFEATSGTTFIGSRSSGANGGVIFFHLPGGVLCGVTGTEIRHADGRQLQRIGIVPEVTVRPTLAGLRAGRDEVLERARKHATTPR